jgi:hypothetical protein
MSRPALILLAAVLPAGPAFGQSAGEEFFEKHVRPVLVERCLACHAAAKTKGGLRLDTRAGLQAGGDGGPVVEAGKPDASRLIGAVRYAGDLHMPPAAKLPAAEIAALQKWVLLGTPWPDRVELAPPDAIAKAAKTHWAFQPVRRPAVTVVQSESRVKNPIDAFVLAELEKHNFAPSPPADKRTLIRRATFDLTGLPPTPDEIAAFEADSSPDAFEKLIDRLLASPRYGERWARHWLDVARYADNKGYVFFEDTNYPWSWAYRDYVISAFNRDLPFDRFILEQIAADQLPSADPKALAALGFLTAGGHFMNNTHDIIDDRIDVVTRGLMGLTVTCARCHDHKFDPVPQADYYSLYGVFRGSREPTVPPLLVPLPETGAYAMYASELAGREKRLVDFVTGRHRELVSGARARAGEYLLAAYVTRDRPPDDDFMLLADRGDLNPAMITRWRTYLADPRTRRDPVWRPWFALADLPEAEFPAKARRALEPVTADPKLNRLMRAAFADAPKSMADAAGRYGKLLAGVEKMWPVARGFRRAKLSDPAAEELRQVLYGPQSPADAPLALDWGFLSLFPDRATQAEYQKLLKDVESLAAKGPPRAMALVDSPRPFDPQVFLRGQPNRLGDPVPRQFLAVANPGRKPFTSGSGRLELAREIVSPTNPLTARVFVNRVWLHHFGRGLVGTPGDFGLRGDTPTHPKLLDWLAADFMGHGWSVKRLHKLIVTSATYRQSSNAECGMRNAESKKGSDTPHSEFRIPHSEDPENRLLWRMNRRRLEFEALHDAMLAVSGGLDAKLGGPSVALLGGSRRRAIYGKIDRLEFPSLYATFDVPHPAASSPERTTTTVPPQALFLMNGPFARQCAIGLVSQNAAVKACKEPGAKVDALFLAALGRKPTPDERRLALALLTKGSGDERWVDLAHALLMTNEFAFVD